MKIKDVADRSGFTPAALRYYEELGLLPQPARTAAGYRSYDESTVDRLAFIARAKQLGCTLDEIADLATAWEGGRCGPLQDRLRTVVAGKLADARAQIVELATLVDDLQRAAIALEQHRPDGACDDQCGCVKDSTTAPGPVTVALGTKPAATDAAPPIACTLPTDALHGRLDEWHALLGHATARARTEGRLLLSFAPTVPTDDLMRLVVAEQSCCQFLTFAITVDSHGIALEIGGPADAMPLVDAFFGATS
ncbi:MAG: hypothetical protein RL238_1656 [Actinomycetota bacterium]|jgi:MerR family transcriptional regulator, copper efflux regulator